MVDSARARSLEQLLHEGWDQHDDESEHLARELEVSAEKEVPSNQLAPFLHLCTHTIGEHLGDWPRALTLGKRVLSGQTPSLETGQAWGRLYVAAVLAGDFVEATDLELSYLKVAGDDFGPALLDMRFMLAGALVSSKRASEGTRVYRGALDLAGQMRQSSFLDRTIAVASNNLGWELYELSSRTSDQDAAMQLCAETSLEYWLKCGTWINEARALYLKAVVANAVGEAAAGLAHADAGLAMIAANSERPLDAARLQLTRAVSFAQIGEGHESARAIREADASASRATATKSSDQFAAERAKVVAVIDEATRDGGSVGA
jgi:hypothetical protein